MPAIKIKEKEIPYEDGEVITLSEGLIGMPDVRRFVIVPMDEFEPFCWLASVDSDKHRFVVVNPKEIVESYDPELMAKNGEQCALAIVKISSDWTKTTINLRAPILIDKDARSAVQVILSDSDYQFAESLVRN
jgi:flagellar assembly factor FliW